MRDLRSLSPGLLLVAVVAASCVRDEAVDHRRTFDLVAELPLATVRAETAYLDIGSPAARAHLESGWSFDESEEGSGETFAWAIGDESVLSFDLFWPRDLQVTLRGRTPGAAEGPMAVSVSVNGRPAGDLELGPTVETHRLPLPQALLRAGGNRLALSSRLSESELAGRKRRQGLPLAVAWYSFAFGSAGRATPAPGVRAGGEVLALPYGTQVDYYLRLPGDSFLTVDEVGSRSGGGTLEVEIETESRGPELLAEVAPGKGSGEVALGGGKTEIARVVLRARPPSGGAPPEHGLLLSRPRLLLGAGEDSLPEAGNRAPRAAVLDRPGRPAGRPDIIVYLVDTLRSDQLGSYGHPGELTPNVDRFARTATLFERSLAQSSFTPASVGSLFTGLWPFAHGAGSGLTRPLDASATTLAELLRQAGYRTMGIVTNGTVDSRLGFDQGFDEYRYERVGSDELTTLALEWLAGAGSEAPLFLYLHAADPHTPYNPPDEFRRRAAPQVPAGYPLEPPRDTPATAQEVEFFRALYQAEIAHNDLHFGRLMDGLATLGRFDSSLVVFLADHGEEFQEHGRWRHRDALYGESIHTPLIIKLPGQAEPRRVAEMAQHIDLLPTILDTLGVAPLPGLEGRSLAPLLGPDATTMPPGPPRRAFTFVMPLGTRQQVSVIEGRWKLVQTRRRDRVLATELYDLEADPAERFDLADQRPVVTAYLAQLLATKMSETSQLGGRDVPLTKELEADLRALGYLG